jgi:Uma2 family endonuclease
MSLADSPARPMTTEALMALPDDDVERELIRGELRERPVRLHTPSHSEVAATVGSLLMDWFDGQPEPRGMMLSSAAAFRLCRNPDSFVGIDVDYARAELAASITKKSHFLDGPPVLAVEILEPWDTHGDIVERVELFLEVGTVVWVIDPYFRTVMVHRPSRMLEYLTAPRELSGDPQLPGFHVPVAKFFES